MLSFLILHFFSHYSQGHLCRNRTYHRGSVAVTVSLLCRAEVDGHVLRLIVIGHPPLLTSFGQTLTKDRYIEISLREYHWRSCH